MSANLLTSKEIKRYASEAGFDLCGITTPEVIPHAAQRLRKWLNKGLQGEMSYMEKEPERRMDPSKTLAGVRSIIILAINYYQPDHASPGPEHGRVARYARGRDYHKVFESRTKNMLKAIQSDHPDLNVKQEFRWFVDYGPFLEKAYAEKAGMGYIGTNSMLITEEFGSWILLSEILTTLELAPDVPVPGRHGACGSCRRCVDHCPTGAIIAPGVVDANKCISYLTIEKRTEIERELRKKLNGKVFGCDICQEVCPHNQRAQPTKHIEFAPASGVGEFLDLKKICEMSDREDFLELTAGTALTRPKLAGLRRTASAILAHNAEPKNES